MPVELLENCGSAEENRRPERPYRDPLGNDFWGVETLVRDGTTYILASARDYGLFIFQDP